jgi:small-conductance mechanosensitive channel
MASKDITVAAALAAMLAVTTYGWIHTRAPTSGAAQNSATPAASQAQLVDQSPLTTAQKLARLASAGDEQPFVEDALRIADHEVDLAFTAALKEVSERPPPLSAAAKKIEERLQRSEKLLEGDQARASQLTAAVAKASGDRKDDLDDELELVQAQIELDQDEVEEAKQDLLQAGGDAKQHIQTMVQEHDAAAKPPAAAPASRVVVSDEPGLIHRFQQWSVLQQKQSRLHDAKGAAEDSAASLLTQRNSLAARVEVAKASVPELARHAQQGAATATPAAAVTQVQHSRDDATDLLNKTEEIAADQQAITVFDKRIAAQKQLASVYGKWSELVSVHQREIISSSLLGLAYILGILLVLLFFDRWLRQLLERTHLDRRQVGTLRTTVRVALQVLAVLCIVLLITGPPGQLGTFLGLAGAGLTVALKDFIVAFIGWLVLMGKNGIRLGDWVEINGVSGEVVELGIFHTVLLETGNWTDSGHPTGRRVTFTNSFAIEGHYFNFSTSGQWLWDELQLVIPTGQDPYPIIDAIHKNVLAVTQDSARQAEQEWGRAARSSNVKTLSGAPAINVKPIIGGVEVSVRYVVRANERYQLRAKLFQTAVDLLGQKPRPQTQSAGDTQSRPGGPA